MAIKKISVDDILRKQKELEKTKKRRENENAQRLERQRRERERLARQERKEEDQRMTLWGGTVISVGFADRFKDNFALLAGILLTAMEDFEKEPELAKRYIEKYKGYCKDNASSEAGV